MSISFETVSKYKGAGVRFARTLILIGLLFSYYPREAASQNWNPDHIFQTFLYLEPEYLHERMGKDSIDLLQDLEVLFKNYETDVKLMGRELGAYNFFYFYEVRSLLNQKQKLKRSNTVDRFGHGMTCKRFVFAVNAQTLATYRIQGFDTNDFRSFIFDFMGRTWIRSSSKSIKKRDLKFWDNQFDIDFMCLFKAMKSYSYDLKKYPCLEKCSDPISIH